MCVCACGGLKLPIGAPSRDAVGRCGRQEKAACRPLSFEVCEFDRPPEKGRIEVEKI